MKLRKIFIPIFTFILIFSGNSFATEVNENDISVSAALLIETNTNKVLYEKNADQRMYPASTTKIMTAILTLENCELDEKVTVSFDTIQEIPEYYGTFGLQANEELTVSELLHLTLIASANDAACILAEHIAGSQESFASMMNTKAHEIGCTGTNFTNPYGMHSENHYTTANDLYLIAKYAMENENFRAIVRKGLYILYPTNVFSNERKVSNTNLFLDMSSEFYDNRIQGIKTGFTTPAGNCLVTFSTNKELNLISVVMGGERNTLQQYESTKALINHAFDNYSYKTLYEANSYYDTIEITNATEESKYLKVLIQDDLTVFIDNETLNSNIEPTVTLTQDPLRAPIRAGEIVGTLTVNILDVDYTTNLIAANDVYISELSVFLFTLCVFVLIFSVLIKLVRKTK